VGHMCKDVMMLTNIFIILI